MTTRDRRLVFLRNTYDCLITSATPTVTLIILVIWFATPAPKARTNQAKVAISYLGQMGCGASWGQVFPYQAFEVVTVTVFSQDTLADVLRIVEHCTVPFDLRVQACVLPRALNLPRNVAYCSFEHVLIPSRARVTAHRLHLLSVYRSVIGEEVIFDLAPSTKLYGVYIDYNEGERRFLINCGSQLIHLVLENKHELALAGLATSRHLLQFVLKGYHDHPAEVNRLLTGAAEGGLWESLC